MEGCSRGNQPPRDSAGHTPRSRNRMWSSVQSRTPRWVYRLTEAPAATDAPSRLIPRRARADAGSGATDGGGRVWSLWRGIRSGRAGAPDTAGLPSWALVPSGTPESGFEAQARWLDETLPTLIDLGASRVFWFQLDENPAAPSGFGLLGPDLSPRPAYAALQSLVARAPAGA
jgi:hypothetical protein